MNRMVRPHPQKGSVLMMMGSLERADLYLELVGV